MKSRVLIGLLALSMSLVACNKEAEFSHIPSPAPQTGLDGPEPVEGAPDSDVPTVVQPPPQPSTPAPTTPAPTAPPPVVSIPEEEESVPTPPVTPTPSGPPPVVIGPPQVTPPPRPQAPPVQAPPVATPPAATPPPVAAPPAAPPTPARPEVPVAVLPPVRVTAPALEEEVTVGPLEVTTVVEKLDILFLLHSSDSVVGQMEAAFENMEAQLRKLISEYGTAASALDFQVGVLLANGPDAFEDSYTTVPTHAQLFKVSGDQDDHVLRSSEWSQSFSRAEVINKVVESLRFKIHYVQSQGMDQSQGGGEMGLLSLYQALTFPHRYKRNTEYGFFRDNASLALIIVADAEDGCVVPQGHTQREPEFGPRVGLPHQSQVNHRHEYCWVPRYQAKNSAISDAAGNIRMEHLNAEMVFEALLHEVGDNDLIVRGIFPGAASGGLSPVANSYNDLIQRADSHR